MWDLYHILDYGIKPVKLRPGYWMKYYAGSVDAYNMLVIPSYFDR